MGLTLGSSLRWVVNARCHRYFELLAATTRFIVVCIRVCLWLVFVFIWCYCFSLGICWGSPFFLSVAVLVAIAEFPPVFGPTETRLLVQFFVFTSFHIRKQLHSSIKLWTRLSSKWTSHLHWYWLEYMLCIMFKIFLKISMDIHVCPCICQFMLYGTTLILVLEVALQVRGRSCGLLCVETLKSYPQAYNM